MTIKLLFALAGLLYCILAMAQQPAAGISMRGGFGNEINISDVNGRPFKNNYADITGSPFLDTGYKFSNVILTTGQKFTGIKTRINLAAQETVFITANGIEAFIPQGGVNEITYSDTTAGNIILPYQFKTGFPPVDKLTNYHFYQVLAAGRCMLLKSITKNISEKKNDLSGEITREFETYENYYIYTNATMVRMKKDKDFILSALQYKQSEVNQFLQTNKMNFKNENNLVMLFSFYNSLQ